MLQLQTLVDRGDLNVPRNQLRAKEMGGGDYEVDGFRKEKKSSCTKEIR